MRAGGTLKQQQRFTNNRLHRFHIDGPEGTGHDHMKRSTFRSMEALFTIDRRPRSAGDSPDGFLPPGAASRNDRDVESWTFDAVRGRSTSEECVNQLAEFLAETLRHPLLPGRPGRMGHRDAHLRPLRDGGTA